MIIQNLKKKFLNIEQIRGAMIFDFFSLGIPYVIKNSGCEFVIYDMEHGGLTFDKFKDVQFYKVNKGEAKTASTINEWSSCENLKYISVEDMEQMLYN